MHSSTKKVFENFTRLSGFIPFIKKSYYFFFFLQINLEIYNVQRKKLEK